MKAAAILIIEMRQMIERRHDKINRNQIDAAPLETDAWASREE